MHARQLERRSEAAVTRRRLGERHLGHLQRLQQTRQALQFLFRHSCASAACIVQPPIVGVVAQQQRADVRPAALGIGPAHDDELLAVQALRLDPDAAVAWSVGAIGELRDNTFQAQLAGMLAEAGAVARNMVAVAQTADLLLEQACQLFLPSDERQLRRALPIQEQEIGDEEHELVGPAFVHGRLEATEHWHAIRVQRTQLAVEVR